MFFYLVLQALPLLALHDFRGQPCCDAENTGMRSTEPDFCVATSPQMVYGTSDAVMGTTPASPIPDDSSYTRALSSREEELFNSLRRMNEKYHIDSQSFIMESHESNKNNKVTDLIEQPENIDLLAQKSVEERRRWFKAHLVADKVLELSESPAPEPEPAELAFHNLLARAETGKLEKQFAEEARRVFYEENTFFVWSDVLEGFLKGSYGDEAIGTPVCELVRQMTIKFTSKVELFEFIVDSALRKHRFAETTVSLKVDADRAKYGSSPGKLRTLRVVLEILLIVVCSGVAQMFLSIVWMLQWIGNLLIGRHTEDGSVGQRTPYFSASFEVGRV